MEKNLSNLRGINLNGCLSPFKDNGQPWLVKMPENPHFWVVVFTTKAKLEESCVELGIADYTIKQVIDGRDFVDSIVEGGTGIMLDPYVVENKTRWTEVLLE